MDFISEKLTHTFQVCFVHKRWVPYTRIKSFLGMLLGAFVASFFIDGQPSYSNADQTLNTMFVVTPFLFFGLVLLQSSLQKTFYNADVYVTPSAITMPDFKGEREVFIAFKDIEAMYINYFPLTPLFCFGPYISTHLAIKSVNGERYGVHTFNLSDYRTIVNYLAKVHNVKIKHRFSWWTLTYLSLFPIGFLLGFIV